MPRLVHRLHKIDLQIGQRLKELRISRGLTQEGLGDMLGVSF